MNKQIWTTESIHAAMMEHVAPLPSQNAYASDLATIFSMHIHRNELIDKGFSPDELPAPSAVVVAPTGQGKTYLFRKMAECLDIYIIIIDTSALAAEGWKGISLSQHLATALTSAKSEKAFLRSVLFFDEIDKEKLWGTHNDQGNAMPNILQLFNGGSMTVKVNDSHRQIDISRFTILFGGAFSGLEDIIRKRLNPKAKIGFGGAVGEEKRTAAEWMTDVTLKDLAEYGLMPELLGRIGSILSIPPLQVEDYRQLLTSPAGSVWQKYNNYLHGLYGISLEFTDAAVETIAQKCMASSTGARAVNPLVNDLMRGAILAVESREDICKVILDANDNGCFIRYEYGPRKEDVVPAAATEAAENITQLPVLIIKANNTAALVRKLLRYYRNAEGDPSVVSELAAFLQCTVTFLHKHCRPSEFTMESLEKLANVVICKDTEGYRSPYDIIMGDVGYTDTDAFVTLKELGNEWTQYNLVEAIHVIADYIEKQNYRATVRFVVAARR